MADAALAGLDLGETITIPSLPDQADLAAYLEKRATLQEARHRLKPSCHRYPDDLPKTVRPDIFPFIAGHAIFRSSRPASLLILARESLIDNAPHDEICTGRGAPADRRD